MAVLIDADFSSMRSAIAMTKTARLCFREIELKE